MRRGRDETPEYWKTGWQILQVILHSFCYWNWKFGSNLFHLAVGTSLGVENFEKLKMTTAKTKELLGFYDCWKFAAKLKTMQVPRTSVIEVRNPPTQNFGSQTTAWNQNFNHVNRFPTGRPKIFIRHWPKQNPWRRPRMQFSQSENLVARQRPNFKVGAKFWKQAKTGSQQQVLTIFWAQKTKTQVNSKQQHTSCRVGKES